MPEPETAAAAPQIPAAETPKPDAQQGDYNPQWLEGLDGRRKADVDAWAEHYHLSKRKDSDTELQSLRTKLGVANKAADPAIVAMLGDHDTFLDELKQAAVTLYGVADEDVKEATTIRELRLLVRGLRTASGSKQKAAAAAPADADPATQQLWEEFKASRGGGKPAIPPGSDRPLAGGPVSPSTYRDRLKNGPMPSASEIDRDTAAWLSRKNG